MAVRFPRLVGREGEDKFEEEDREVEKLVSAVGKMRLEWNKSLTSLANHTVLE